MTIKLTNLPYLVYKETFLHMGVVDLICLSLTSQKMNQSIKSYIKPLPPSFTIKIHVSNTISIGISENFEQPLATFHAYDFYGARYHHSEATFGCYKIRYHSGSTCQVLHAYCRNVIYGARWILMKILELFPLKIEVVRVEFDCLGLFNLLTWINKMDPEKLYWENAGNYFDLIENIDILGFVNIHSVPSDEHHRSLANLKSKIFTIRHSSWVNLENLKILTTSCVCLRLLEFPLQEDDLNEFLKFLVSTPNTKLEYLQLNLIRRFDRDLVMNEIEVEGLVAEADVREYKRYQAETDTKDCAILKLENEKTVTIGFTRDEEDGDDEDVDPSGVEIIVWDDY